MNLKDKIKNWPDEEKKLFSLICSVIITLGIVITWFSFNPVFSRNDGTVNKIETDNTDYFGDSMQKISEQYNLIKNQISDLTATSSTSTASTTTMSTTTEN